MKRTALATLSLALTLATLTATPALAAPTSYDDALDIGALLTTAAQSFDLDRQDAVVLERTDAVRWLADGRRELFVHEIVWIRTEHGIDLYADLRVPYDSDRCDFAVDALRTWRDERWWVSTETAVVPTLPRGLVRADDYVSAREMMLLHDGVEIPCVMETAYRIVDKEPFRPAGDGLHRLARRDPAVRSRFVLAVPPGTTPSFAPADGPAAPVAGRDEERGLDTWTWTAEGLRERARPFLENAAVLEPHVAWSTWASWDALGEFVLKRFEDALVLDDALRDSVATIVAETPGPLARAHRLADFVKRTTRSIAHEPDFAVGSPRPAARTWNTAYGNGLDRAVLATALFRQADLTAAPVWSSRIGGAHVASVPALAWFEGPEVVVEAGDPISFDPVGARLDSDLSTLRDRWIWEPGHSDPAPAVRFPIRTLSQVDVRLEIARDAEAGTWTGSGLFAGGGVLSGYGAAAGLGDEITDRLESVVGGVVADAKIPSANPAAFGPGRVVLGFEVTAPLADPDDYDRIPLVLGDPGGGLHAALPADVHLHEATRGTMVLLPDVLEQTVRVVLDLEGLEIVRMPEDRELANDVGRFAVTVERRSRGEKDELVVTRSLRLDAEMFPPRHWPALRELLLADRHERNRTLLLKPAEEK